MNHDPPSEMDIDLSSPNAARIYDWYLGGSYHFETDRRFGQRAVDLWRHVPAVARENRRALIRVVDEALRAGFRQFLDVGSGIPTVGNVHEIVGSRAPDRDCRVVYVDNEPTAVQAAVQILDQQDAQHWCGVIREDMRNPHGILEHPDTTRLIDITQPVCLLMFAVWHFISDGIPAYLAEYTSALAPGSWIAISHIACERAPVDDQLEVHRFAKSYEDTQTPLVIRTRDQIAHWFTGLELLDPGIVALPDWRPDGSLHPDTKRVRHFAWLGVGQRPKH